MHELSLYHIDQITRDISKQEITFSHLIYDLIDHVCCDVEYEMQMGLDFSEAYKKVKRKMGEGRLKEIQKETLYAIDLKYRKMKKTMKISGIVGTILFGCATLFKIMHWPLAGSMLTLGAFTLVFIFMPSTLGVLWKETHNRNKQFLFISGFLTGIFFVAGTLFKVQHWPAAFLLLSIAAFSGLILFLPSLIINRFGDEENRQKRPVYIVGSIGIVLYVLGMLFKIQHWPASTFMMVLGVIALVIIGLPWYTWITWKEENHITSGFLYILIGTLVIIVPGALVNLNLQSNYNEGFFDQTRNQQLLYNSIFENNMLQLTLHHDSLNYGDLEKVHNRTVKVLDLIGDIQMQMIRQSESEMGKPEDNKLQINRTESGPDINFKNLSEPFSKKPADDFLIPGNLLYTQLESALRDYSDFLMSIPSVTDMRKYLPLLKLSPYFSPSPETTGETTLPLITALHSLYMLKTCIVTLESGVLSDISKTK